ncbi:hypothetical protein BRD17_05215 [Halobacteriales archaeon SW_7_68_16]|nr:MAG: hypothetical protein BRD17_05215 [Halobacteriales archaeon SW_7_68_16]
MGKVSIGLRGWRFDEDAIFTADGEFRPFDEVTREDRRRLVRLSVLVGSPCDACWLEHGDENLTDCEEATVIYGEPLAEVLLCDDHEADFVYWFHEVGGREYAGEPELEDRFHEWIADGGRAPGGDAGIDHVDTDPEELPQPPAPDPDDYADLIDDDPEERIDIRDRIDLDDLDSRESPS